MRIQRRFHDSLIQKQAMAQADAAKGFEAALV